MGVNLIAAVPTGLSVPELGGPGAAMSGTSMSNPGVFGAFLLLTRGILVLLKDGLPAGPLGGAHAARHGPGALCDDADRREGGRGRRGG